MKNTLLLYFITAITVMALSVFGLAACSNDGITGTVTDISSEDSTDMKDTDQVQEITENQEDDSRNDDKDDDMDIEEASDDDIDDDTLEEDTEDEMEGSFSYMDVTPQEAKKLIDENPDLIIIDVSPNYDEGHLPGAVSYYIGDGSLDEAIPSLDPEGKYLVYCHVDSVAIAGAQKLIDAGFEKVYRLEGNYSAWVEAGYPIEK